MNLSISVCGFLFQLVLNKEKGRSEGRDKDKGEEGVCFDADFSTWELAKEARFGKPV